MYGCNRISKPFGRIDKFKEHFQKQHQGAHTFLCLFESCNTGPFSLHSLAGHLISSHLHEYSRALNLDGVMKIVSPDVLIGRVVFDIAAKQQEGKDVCPLQFLGCSFRLSVKHPKMVDHLQNTHEITHLAKFYDTIMDYGVTMRSLNFGLIICFICQWQCDSLWRMDDFLEHLDTHPEQEQRNHIEKLCEMHDALISKKALISHYCYPNLNRLIQKLQKWNEEDMSQAVDNNFLKQPPQERKNWGSDPAPLGLSPAASTAIFTSYE